MRIIIFLSIITLFGVFNLANAQEVKPDVTMNNILTEIAAKDTVLVAYNYVDWDGFYQNLSTVNRQHYQVSSAEELKIFFEKLYKEPADYLSNKNLITLPYIQGMKEEDLQQIDEALDEVKTQLREVLLRGLAQLPKTKLSTDGVTQNGVIANVKVKAEVGGDSEEVTLILAKSGDKWVIRDLAPLFELAFKVGSKM